MNLTKKVWAVVAGLFVALVLITVAIKLLLQIRIDAQMMQEDLEQKDREMEIALDEVAKGRDPGVEYIPPTGAPKPNVEPPPPNEN